MAERGVLWEMTSCGVIRGSGRVAVTHYEPFQIQVRPFMKQSCGG